MRNTSIFQQLRRSAGMVLGVLLTSFLLVISGISAIAQNANTPLAIKRAVVGKVDPCSPTTVTKTPLLKRLEKTLSREAREKLRADEAVKAAEAGKFKLNKPDCPDGSAANNAEDGDAPKGIKLGARNARNPDAEPAVPDTGTPGGKSFGLRPQIPSNENAGDPKQDNEDIGPKGTGVAVLATGVGDICGDPNRIAVLNPQEAQDNRNQLNAVLSKAGFANAGQGQRVPIRWYFDLPFRTTVAEMKGKRGAPVNDTAVLTKIMGFSVDCNVISAFSKQTQQSQPVTANYDVTVEFKSTDGDQFQSLGSFFKGAPATIFAKPGIYKLTAIPQGKISPFNLGQISHTVRVDSAALKRPFGITQILVRNPGNVPGSAFVIGARKSADTDAKRQCKNYRFSAFIRSGKILSESATTIQTSRPSNKQYNKASFELFQNGRLLDQQGPGAFYNFDAKKFGDGNFALKAKIAREDQGPGPGNYQVPETQHVISVFRCGVINAPEIAAKPGGAEKKPELDPIANPAPPEQGGDIPGVIVHELVDGEVVTELLPPERFLKNAQAPTVAGPFLGSCEACKREIARRLRVQKRSCNGLVQSMQQLIFNAPIYNQKQIEYEEIFKDEILGPMGEFRASQLPFVSQMREFIEKAAISGVLQTNAAQQAHQAALGRVAKRDRARLAKNPAVKLSIPLIIQDDLPGRIGGEVFALVPGLVARVKNSRSDFVKINTEFNSASAEARAKAEAFVANELPGILERLQDKLDEMKEIQKIHLEVQAGIAGTFASRSHEHCLGTPGEAISVVDGQEGNGTVDGIPGMNVLLKDHPDNRPSAAEFLLAAVLDPPKDQTFEGLEDYSPLKFKFDGVAYKNFEADFRRRFADLNGFFFTTAAAIGGGLQTTGKVIKAVGKAVTEFAKSQAKAAIDIGTAGLLFEGEARKNLDNFVEFIVKDLPQGIDIVVGTDLAGFIIEANRVKQSDKFDGVKVLQAISGLGVGQLAELIGKSTVEAGIDVVDAAALATEQALRDEDFVGSFSDEVAEQDTINKGIGSGIVLGLDLGGLKLITIGAKFIKFGGKTFKSVDKAVDAANARRLSQGKKPLSTKEIAKFRAAQSYATKANELLTKIRVDQNARLLAKAADRAAKVDGLVGAAKAGKLTDESIEVALKGSGEATPSGGLGLVDDVPVTPKPNAAGRPKNVEAPPKPIADAKQPTKQPPKQNAGAKQPPKPKDDGLDFFRQADEAGDVAKPLDELAPPKPKDDGLDFFRQTDEVKAADNVANKLDEAAEAAAKKAKAIEDLNKELARRKKAGDVGPFKPKKLDVKDVDFPADRFDAISNPKKGDTLGQGSTTSAIKKNPADPNSDVLKPFEKKSAADSKVIVDDQITGAKKLEDAGANFLNIKGRGKVEVNTQIANAKGKLEGPKVKRTNDFLVQEQFPKDAIELEKLIDGRRAAGIKPLLSEAEQVEILRQFHLTSKNKLVLRDTNLGNIAAKTDGEALFIESGSVIDAPTAKVAREAQAEHLFGSGSRAEVNQKTADVFKKAGDNKTNVQIRLNGPGGGASGTGGQGGFKDLISKDLQKKFRDGDEFEKFLQEFDLNKKAKAAGDVPPPKPVANGNTFLPKKGIEVPPTDPNGIPVQPSNPSGQNLAKQQKGLEPTVPGLSKGEEGFTERAIAKFNKDAADARVRIADRQKTAKGAKQTPDEIRAGADKIAADISAVKLAEKKAKTLENRLRARRNQTNPEQFKKFEGGKINEQELQFPEDRIKSILNPKQGESFGQGSTTTALKADPKNPNTPVLKPFEKVSSGGSKIIRDDQFTGGKRLAKTDANFLSLEGKGTVKFVDTRVGKLSSGKVIAKTKEVENAFLRQQQLPKDAVILEDIISGGRILGLEESQILSRVEQVEILRNFHKSSKGGLVLRDTNPGNIATKADAEAIFVESGSVLEINKIVDGKTVPNSKAAHEAQAAHLFGQGSVDEVNKRTAKIFRDAGEKQVADAIETPIGKKTFEQQGISGASGEGGHGNFKNLIAKDLQDKFTDPVAFERFLNKFDADLAAKKAARDQQKALDAAASKLKQKVADAKALKLEADRLAGNPLDPSVLNKTPQFTPEQVKNIQKLQTQAKVADLRVKTAEKLVKSADTELAKARKAGASQVEIANLEKARKEANNALIVRNRNLVKVARDSNELAEIVKPQIPAKVQADAIKKALEKKRKLIANDNSLPGASGQAANQ